MATYGSIKKNADTSAQEDNDEAFFFRIKVKIQQPASHVHMREMFGIGFDHPKVSSQNNSQIPSILAWKFWHVQTPLRSSPFLFLQPPGQLLTPWENGTRWSQRHRMFRSTNTCYGDMSRNLCNVKCAKASTNGTPSIAFNLSDRQKSNSCGTEPSWRVWDI